jgi:metal-responsive CopG/Arc/MetJ family transcriptional regulator
LALFRLVKSGNLVHTNRYDELEEGMRQKVKLTVSLDQDLVETLDEMSRQSKKPRSQVVQEALRSWRQRELHEKLAQGYRSMAEEDRETAEQRLAVFKETLK